MSFLANLEQLEPRRLLAATMVSDIGAGSLHAHPSELTVAGGRLYFIVDTHSTGGLPSAGWFFELWSTDGSRSGTRRLTQVQNRASGTTGTRLDSRDASALPFYNGPRSLVATGDTLWYYEISHRSSQQLQIRLSSFAPSGPGPSYDLGEVNLSLRQRLHDPQVVEGQLYIYRDAEFWNPDPERQRAQWWTIDGSELTATGITDRNAFSGAGPAYAINANLRGTQYFVYNDGVHGRELWRDIAPPADKILRISGTGGNDNFQIRRQLGSADLLILMNNSASTYGPGELNQIRVSLGNGNDRAMVSESLGKISIPVSIHGGAGNDLLMGASARDTLYGGDGHDTLYGGGENDYLFGQGGNDRLAGGGGRDVLWGGEGRNVFVASLPLERRDAGSDDVLA